METDKDRNFSYEEHSSTIIDRLAANVRYKKIDSILNSLNLELKDLNFCDVGCGYNCNFLMHLNKKYKINNLYGVDVNINPSFEKKINFIRTDLENAEFDIESNSINVVTSLAVIEHLRNPKKYLSEINRILIKDGIFILTTPSKFAKPILYFLAYTGIGTKEEIMDHKLYYTKKLLNNRLDEYFKNIKISFFSFGINIYCIGEKK